MPLLVITALLFTVYGIAYSELPRLSSVTYPERIANASMRKIMTAWHIQIMANPNEPKFDRDAAESRLQNLYSPYSESGMANSQAVCAYVLRWSPLFVIPTVIYLLVVAFLVGKSAKRRSFVIILILLLGMIPCVFSNLILNLAFPGTNAFMRDFAFVPGVDITPANPNSADTIAMYSVRDFTPYGRIGIAFGDRHVRWLPYERAEPLFKAQGIPFPKPTE
ncbi:MAG: hypothetical protein DHS20C16_12290 [Phycisphaerae bacterium]|nr:MAG: hypothetical protein DHS20C16_12290 [Phycisphaerae bacterium]